MIAYAIFFLLGGIVGTIMSLFIAGAGRLNKECDAYQQGFIDGQKKRKD